jgi:hypothetical protein
MPDSPVPIIAALALHGDLAGLLVLIHAAWPLRVKRRKPHSEHMVSGLGGKQIFAMRFAWDTSLLVMSVAAVAIERS